GKFELDAMALHPQFKPINEDETETYERYSKLQDGIQYILEVTELTPSARGRYKPFASKIQQRAGVDTWGTLAFSLRPQDSPIIHFDGPLSLDVSVVEPKLERRSEPFDFR